jgi:hypothetical protein
MCVDVTVLLGYVTALLGAWFLAFGDMSHIPEKGIP